MFEKFAMKPCDMTRGTTMEDAYQIGKELGKTPSEEFELTANSLGAHIETHCWLTVNSQDELTL